MGINQSSSCHAGSSCAVIPTSYSLSLASAYTGSMKDGSVMEPCAAAKVLLLDGRVLHFTSKVRASQVLAAGFRHHCICPLDSANLSSSHDTITTFFKPVSLRPDDLLRPPNVYILLPRRTCRLFAAAAAAATRNTGNGGRMHRNSGSRVCDSGAYACTGSSTGICHTGASASPKVCSTCKSSRVCNISTCPSIAGAHGGSRVCDTTIASDTVLTCGTHRIADIQTRRIPLQSYHIRATEPVRPTPPSSHRSVDGSSTLPSLHLQPRRRSLDLHHASSSRHRRPLGMRRCRSWRPKLQAINEVHVYS